MAFDQALRRGSDLAAMCRGAGRPVLPETLAVRDFLASVPADTGAPVRQVARSLQLSVGEAHKIVDRLARKGEVREVRRARVPGVKKPVCCYAATSSGPEADGDTPAMFDVLRFGIVSLD